MIINDPYYFKNTQESVSYDKITFAFTLWTNLMLGLLIGVLWYFS